MKHRHHIIPRHAGGTDDPSNLVELTIEEHSRAHYILWNQYGRPEDKLAWRALSGAIGKEEIIFERYGLGGTNTWKKSTKDYRRKLSDAQKRIWEDPVYRAKHTKVLLEHQANATKLAQTEEAMRKRKETYKLIGHQQGPTNAMFGRKWVTNGTETILLGKDEPIPEGFVRGKKIKST